MTAAGRSASGFGMAVQDYVLWACDFERAFAFENQRDSRLDTDHRGAYFGEQFHRRRTNRRAIEAHVLSGFRCFGNHQSRTDQPGCAAQRDVRTFQRLHRGDHSVADCDRLTDVVGAESARDLECEIEIAALRWSGLGTVADA